MNPEELKKRTKQFGLRVIQLVARLPKSNVGFTIGGQLLRSGTGVGSNYRAACRARSRADFAAKVGIAEEEADESAYWLEMLIEAQVMKRELLSDLFDEANALTAILGASRKTAKNRKNPTE
jgi:four helix bundle protein